MPFKPGESGNPAGRPPGTRSTLRNRFEGALLEDFEINGAAAIVAVRSENPAKYLDLIASLMPKDVSIKQDVTVHSEPLSETDAWLAGITEGPADSEVPKPSSH